MLKKMPLAAQIFIALVLGIIAGLLLQNHTDFAENYIKPFGTIFLNLVKFIVVPIVLFSILAGIISMKDIRKVGSIGIKTIIYYLCTTAVAIVMALLIGFAIILVGEEAAPVVTGINRNRRSTRSRNGHAGNGSYICWTSC